MVALVVRTGPPPTNSWSRVWKKAHTKKKNLTRSSQLFLCQSEEWTKPHGALRPVCSCFERLRKTPQVRWHTKKQKKNTAFFFHFLFHFSFSYLILEVAPKEWLGVNRSQPRIVGVLMNRSCLLGHMHSCSLSPPIVWGRISDVVRVDTSKAGVFLPPNPLSCANESEYDG